MQLWGKAESKWKNLLQNIRIYTAFTCPDKGNRGQDYLVALG